MADIWTESYKFPQINTLYKSGFRMIFFPFCRIIRNILADSYVFTGIPDDPE